MLGAAAALAALASPPAPSAYSPTFGASALTSHDPARGWSVNPDNMPIGNGRLVGLVWSDGNHANTSGVGVLLARDDAYTELVQLVKLGRVRIQMQPDPFANASAFTQRLDLEAGEVQINATSGDGALSVALRLSVDPQVDALVVELLSASAPVTVSARLELWREERPWAEYTESGCQHPPCKHWSETGMLHGICAADNYTQHADTVLDHTAQHRLAWYYRNPDAQIWETTLRHQDTADVLDELPDPLLNRTFGGMVAGDTGGGASWVASSPLQMATAKAVTSARLAVMTHTAQTATAALWTKEIAARLAASSPASATRVAAAHTERKAILKEFWARSHVHIGEMAPPPQVPPSFRTANTTLANVTNASILVNSFACTAPDRCPHEAAAACLAKGAACQSFAVAGSKWQGPNGQSKSGVPIEAQLYTTTFQSCPTGSCAKQPWGGRGSEFGGSTLWIKSDTSAPPPPPPAPLPAPFLLNQNYLLFRYQQLIQGNGTTAIHFSACRHFRLALHSSDGPLLRTDGGIIDWGATGDNSQPKGVPDHGNVDFRQWGSGFWFQNVRMAYYPNLADGDGDQLLGLFRHYHKTMPVLRSRAKNWFGTTKGSMFFAETSLFWGSYEPDDFGCEDWNATNRKHQGYGPKDKPDVDNPFMWRECRSFPVLPSAFLI